MSMQKEAMQETALLLPASADRVPAGSASVNRGGQDTAAQPSTPALAPVRRSRFKFEECVYIRPALQCQRLFLRTLASLSLSLAAMLATTALILYVVHGFSVNGPGEMVFLSLAKNRILPVYSTTFEVCLLVFCLGVTRAKRIKKSEKVASITTGVRFTWLLWSGACSSCQLFMCVSMVYMVGITRFAGRPDVKCGLSWNDEEEKSQWACSTAANISFLSYSGIYNVHEIYEQIPAYYILMASASGILAFKNLCLLTYFFMVSCIFKDNAQERQAESAQSAA